MQLEKIFCIVYITYTALENNEEIGKVLNGSVTNSSKQEAYHVTRR
jgi:hypothetical protein